MKPFNTIAQVRTPDGATLALLEHDGEHYLKLNGRQLMSSFATASELALAQHSCARLAGVPQARVLIGGLGLGYTLQRVLELVDKSAVVHVAELIPEVVTWNRELLHDLNGKLLDDPRVEVFVADVFALLKRSAAPRYDAILLDLDNGPVSMMQPENSRVYDRQGFARITRALLPDGCVAFWSASEDLQFVNRLSHAGFDVQTFPPRPTSARSRRSTASTSPPAAHPSPRPNRRSVPGVGEGTSPAGFEHRFPEGEESAAPRAITQVTLGLILHRRLAGAEA